MTKVFIAQHPAEAYLVAGLLASQGIGAEVRGESLFNVRGEVPVTPATLPTVWVLDDKDADTAREILRDQGPPAKDDLTAAPWRCANCGEQIEPQFVTCWNCNSPRGVEG